ncbi:MAG: folate-binding protein [Methylococcales bacterium]|nr:folate-binding protein [Methylococcales bacterium]
MNSNWKNALLTHLAVLTVSGTDAAQFLQGQITCNVHEVTATHSSLGAMCNPKGRAITTFLLAKSGDDFLLILPVELLETVKKRLSMYVLRSKVTLTDCSDSLCLLGFTATLTDAFLASYQQDGVVRINVGNRDLVIADEHNASVILAQGVETIDSMHWQTLDILGGIPWLTTATSEQFIPQMLNLDKLGGISLTKGCYTGQEIVARTHYLGKAKRALFVAECETATPEANASIIDANGQIVGNVLSANDDKLLIVLQLAETDTTQLQLKDYHHASLTLLTKEHS